ncbi:MAG: DUF2784 domain-containing protein [Gammaproteobacteria bacterium]
MLSLFLADLVLVIHLMFIIFVVFGGVLVYKWHPVMWFHLPCVVWGVLLEFRGWVCPLTYLEDYLREAGGADRYGGDFIRHYLVPLVYPPGLTADIQILLGCIALIINLLAYSFVWHHWRSH